MLSVYEITKKKLKLKLLQGLISEETKNCSKKLRRESIFLHILLFFPFDL